MKRIILFQIFLVIITCISCTHREVNRISKFIYIKGIDISYDSLGKPQLQIVRYVEFSPDEKVRIAIGKRFLNYPDADTAPAFNLTEFYELPNGNYLEPAINKTFIGKSYDSLYFTGRTEGHYYNFFIWETSSGEKKEILYYYNGKLPGELDSLDRLINRLFDTQKLIKTKRFEVHPLLVDLQRELFKRNPPPPLPSKMQWKEFKAPEDDTAGKP